MKFTGATPTGYWSGTNFHADTAWSYTFWLRPASLPASRQQMFFRDDTAFNEDINITLEASNGGIQFTGTGAGNVGDGTALKGIGAWDHIAVVKANASPYYSIYRNGNLLATGTSNTTTPTTHSEYSIGFRHRSGADQGFDGDIAKVYIWERALSEGEVKWIYYGNAPTTIGTNLWYVGSLETDLSNAVRSGAVVFDLTQSAASANGAAPPYPITTHNDSRVLRLPHGRT